MPPSTRRDSRHKHRASSRMPYAYSTCTNSMGAQRGGITTGISGAFAHTAQRSPGTPLTGTWLCPPSTCPPTSSHRGRPTQASPAAARTGQPKKGHVSSLTRRGPVRTQSADTSTSAPSAVRATAGKGATPASPQSQLPTPVKVQVLKRHLETTHVTPSLYHSVTVKAMYVLMFHAFLRVGQVTQYPNVLLFKHVNLLPSLV
jgi:hypothetical protein